MILARIFTNIYKEGGIVLIDAKGQKYICGNPKKEKPITLKLLKENLNWKLLLDPELEFPEAYMRIAGTFNIELNIKARFRESRCNNAVFRAACQ